MLPELLQSTNLFYLLHRIDIDLAEQQKLAGCPFCGGPLHYSNYQRKPRGGPDTLPEKLYLRLSLCCGVENCRRRTLPPSTLFMDRRVYFRSVILIVLTLMQKNPRKHSKTQLMRMFEVSRKAINRWQEFFRDIFPLSVQWQWSRGRISSAVKNSDLPGGVVAYFIEHTKSAEEAIVNCLQFMATGYKRVKRGFINSPQKMGSSGKCRGAV